MTEQDYELKSARLGFRKWTMADLEEFAEMNADEEVMEHFPKTLSKDEVRTLIERLQQHHVDHGYTYYATEILDTGALIGMIGLAYQEYKTAYTPATDIGWRLKKSAWGKGYATEGAKRCLEHAFETLGIQQVISVCTLSNTKSANVMKKIGMTRLGSFDHPDLVNYPEYVRHDCYVIKAAQ